MPSERVFWPVLAGVVLAHYAFLTQWRFAQAAAAPRQQGPQVTQAVFRVRPVQPAPVPAVPAAPQVSPPAAVPVPVPPAEVQAPPPAVAEGAVPAPAIAARGAAPAPASPPPAPPSPVPDAPYLPRAELSVPPRVESFVDVAFPEDVQGVVDLKVQATLFIDETGTVRKVRVDTADVHPAFERAIYLAFAQARFAPGQVDGQAARSQMRVEVEFHAPGGSLVR